ncbi:MAG: hypothetical protein KatS3mg040_1683 [Candidatus Kapaibacterium sp.]|nr:MAG: hypothetical protein KatS3mg040_1683 [Candidatus Kapabacteria bacterium]
MTVIVLVVLVKIIGVALLVRLIAAFAKRAVFFADALTMVVWALVPVVLFLPFAMVLFRLLAITPPLLWLSLLALTTLWSILRLLRACSIVFEEVPWLVYVAGLGSIAIVAGIAWDRAPVHVRVGKLPCAFSPTVLPVKCRVLLCVFLSRLNIGSIGDERPRFACSTDATQRAGFERT